MDLNTTVHGIGIYSDVKQQVDPTHDAARVSLREPEIGAGGAYSIALVSGVMAAGLAGGSPIFSFRWTDASFMALIRRVRFTAGTDGTAFAQGSTIVDLIRATAFTVQDTGGALLTFAGKSNARATRYAPSKIQIANIATGNIAIANTGTLTAGTRTLDNTAMGVLIGSVGAVPANFPSTQPGLIFDASDSRKSPLELMTNEGFIVRATVPATGTWKFGIEVDWDEVDPARWF